MLAGPVHVGLDPDPTGSDPTFICTELNSFSPRTVEIAFYQLSPGKVGS